MQQSISDVTKLSVVVSHFPPSEKCREFWIIRNRTYTEAGLVLETNNFTYEEPKALIALIGGVEKEQALFEATPPAKPEEPKALEGDGTLWCDTNACEQPTCHRCFPKEGCYDHKKCQEEFKYANRLA